MPLLTETLLRNHANYSCVIPEPLQRGRALWLNLQDKIWAKAHQQSAAELTKLTEDLLQQHSAVLAVGRYAEDRRLLYSRNTDNFANPELRSIHLGLDLSVAAGTKVFAPLAATVYGWSNDDILGGYGPVVVLRHVLDGIEFFTLYGHLSCESLVNLSPGKPLAKGENFATVGNSRENGSWPPHLHFQIIRDMQGLTANYPGVIEPSKQQEYLQNCPDPNLILQLYARSA